MKKTSLLSLFVATTLLYSSCSIISKTCGSDFEQIKITPQGILQKPLVADLDVSKEKKSLSKQYEINSPTMAKELIMGDFVHELKCDVIVHPIFNYCISTKNEKNIINITVEGYPASYKNFRNFELKDTVNFLPSQLNIFKPEKGISMNPTNSEVLKTKKSKSGTLVILGVTTVVALITAKIIQAVL